MLAGCVYGSYNTKKIRNTDKVCILCFYRGPHLELLKKEKPPNKRQKLSDSPDKEFQMFLNDDTDYYKRTPKPPVKDEDHKKKSLKKLATDRGTIHDLIAIT